MLMGRSVGAVAGTSLLDGVVIAPISSGELGEVGAAYHATYLGTPHEMTLAEAVADVEASRRGEYGSWLGEASLLVRDTRAAGEVVGAVLTVRDAPWDDVPPGPFVVDLFVLPSHRRRRLGRALVARALAAVDEPVALRVDYDNASAIALYRGLGFTSLQLS